MLSSIQYEYVPMAIGEADETFFEGFVREPIGTIAFLAWCAILFGSIAITIVLIHGLITGDHTFLKWALDLA